MNYAWKCMQNAELAVTQVAYSAIWQLNLQQMMKSVFIFIHFYIHWNIWSILSLYYLER